jgi:AcrR family transcriptional regulator
VRSSDGSRDRRVRRTRRQLRDALVALILERGWDAVSVQDVCARADVGRSTFYVHFADKEELLLSGFDELHAALQAERRGDGGPFGFVDALIEHAEENLRLYRAVVGRKSGRHVVRRFRDVVLRLVEADLAALAVDGRHRAAVALYVTGGFVELLTSWLDRPASMERGEVAIVFRRLTTGVLSTASPGAARSKATGRAASARSGT